MAAVDVSTVVTFIQDNIDPIALVGVSVLTVYVALDAFKHLAFLLGFSSTSPYVDQPESEEQRENRLIVEKEDRKAREYFSYTEAELAANDVKEAEYHAMWAEQAAFQAATAESDRLADVWQSWHDQIQRAKDLGGVAPAATQNLDLYDKLVARGMDAQDAIAAVEARNASVLRADERQEALHRLQHGAS